MATRRLGITVFLFCMILSLMLCPVQAASPEESIVTDRLCTLDVLYSCEGTPYAGVPVALYHIADVSSDFQYTLTPSFEGFKLTLNGIQSNSEWNKIRTSLEAYILSNRIEENREAVSDWTGKVKFESLTPGLYLVIPEGEVEIAGNRTCVFDSALVALPGLDEDDRWLYQVSVTAKPEILPPVKPNEIIEFQVLKLWKGDNRHEHRPKSVKIGIFRDGRLHETVVLSDENHWFYSWSAKDDGAKWMVVELEVPEGYGVTVERRDNTFIVTNTKLPDDPPGKPPFDPPEKPTEKPTEGPTEGPTEEPTEKPTENPTEKPTEGHPEEVPTEKPPQKPPVTENPKTGDTSHILLYTLLMYGSGMVLVLLGLTGKRRSK